MKKVVSVSLGSSSRNDVAIAEFGGQTFKIERIGVDGSQKKAMEILRKLDGQVAAFSLGGTDLYVYANDQRYTMRQTAKIAAAAQKTPIVDGSGVKNTLERRVIPYLEGEHKICFKGKQVLLVCAIDRFGLAESLADSGADVVFGDLMFGLGLPWPIRSLEELSRLAKFALPVITKLPVNLFYPVGEQQNQARPRPGFTKYFDQAQIIAGDFHFIKRNMPENLAGKTILTNTVTKNDEELLQKRGAAVLITTTPEIGGRSFGANILEGVLVAYAGRGREELSPQHYNALLDELKIKPRVKRLC